MQEQTIETGNPQIETQDVDVQDSTESLNGSESHDEHEEQDQEEVSSDADDSQEGDEAGEEDEEGLLIDLGEGEDDTEASDDDVDVEFSDLRAYVVAGKTDEALKRISAHEKGLAQLKSKYDQQTTVMQGMESMFKAIADGDTEAMLTFEDNFEKTFGKRISVYQDDVEKPERKAGPDPIVTQLQKEIADLKTRLETKDWSSGLGKQMSETVKKATGLEFTPDVLWEAKKFLPKSGKISPDIVVNAVKKADPDAYLNAKEAQTAKKTAPVPKGASLQRGPKPTAQDASALLDPKNFADAWRAQSANKR